MTTPKIAQKAPYPVEVEAGKSYFWCTCGESSKQPFCDASHKGTDFIPMKYTAEESKKNLLLRLQSHWKITTLRRLTQQNLIS